MGTYVRVLLLSKGGQSFVAFIQGTYIHNDRHVDWTGGADGYLFLSLGAMVPRISLFIFYGTRTDLLPYWPTGAAVSLLSLISSPPPKQGGHIGY